MMRLLLLVGIVACILGTVADTLLLYHPDGDYWGGVFSFFSLKSKWMVVVGSYLGILAIPFELVGFWAVFKKVESESPITALLLLLTSFWTLVVGVLVHGLLGFIGLQVIGGQSIMAQNLLFNPLATILVAGIVISSILWVYFVLFKSIKTNRILVFFNPALIYVCLALLAFFFPFLDILLLGGMNIGVGTFFLACLLLLKN